MYHAEMRHLLTLTLALALSVPSLGQSWRLLNYSVTPIPVQIGDGPFAAGTVGPTVTRDHLFTSSETTSGDPNRRAPWSAEFTPLQNVMSLFNDSFTGDSTVNGVSFLRLEVGGTEGLERWQFNNGMYWTRTRFWEVPVSGATLRFIP